MLRLRAAVLLASSFAWKFLISILGIAIVIGLLSPSKPASPEAKEWLRTGRIAVCDDGRKVQATLQVVAGSRTTQFVLCDKEGREIVELHLFESGDLVFRLGGHSPVHMGGSSAPDGKVALVVNAGGNGYEFKVRPNGSAELGRSHGAIEWRSGPSSAAPAADRSASTKVRGN